MSAELLRLRGLGRRLDLLANELEAGHDVSEYLDDAIRELKALRERTYGPRKLEGSGRDRLEGYFRLHVGEWLTYGELAEIAGIAEWARRVRELRAEGWSIETRHNEYRLIELP